MSAWIPVSKEQPTTLKWVIVFAQGRVVPGIWDGESYRGTGGDLLTPTHWMALPSAPTVALELTPPGRPRVPGTLGSVIRDYIETSVGWVLRRHIQAHLQAQFPRISPERRRVALATFCHEAQNAGHLQVRDLKRQSSAILWVGPVSSTAAYEARKKALGI